MSVPGAAAKSSAQKALSELELGQTKSAAWWALAALEQDRGSALAIAVLSRIVLEVTEDPLGALGIRAALDLGLAEPERSQFERFQRIDLWARGFLEHDGSSSLLPQHAFDHPEQFRETPRAAAWLESQLKEWNGFSGANAALLKLAASLADAWIVPDGDGNPLRDPEPWKKTPGFEKWLSDPPPATKSEPQKPNEPQQLALLSDYWMEQEIMRLGAQANFELALERAKLWTQLRPDRVRPRAALVRVLGARGQIADRDQTIAEILALGTHDLNELEEARVVLGELELWKAQVQLLDQMNRVAPGHAVILSNRGVARIEIGEVEGGIADLEAALVADPDHGPALANLGLQRMKSDEYVAARTLLERAVTVAPDQPQVRLYLAACKNNQDDRPGAISELEVALRLEPSNQQARQLLDELLARGPIARS